MFGLKDLPKHAKKWEKELTAIASKGIISPMLFQAITEITVALKAQNWSQAYQLSAVKSYICGNLNPKDKKNAFQEDREANERTLKASVYMILDLMHHDIAFALEELPSGAMLLSDNGQAHSMKSIGSHPIIMRMKKEHRDIQKWPGKARKYPLSDWQYEVQNGDTVLGYKEWVKGRLECDEAISPKKKRSN